MNICLPALQLEQHIPPPDAATWQLLTGHESGQVKLWVASEGRSLQHLARFAAPTFSPVRSLILLGDLHLLCFAHADGHLALHIIPHHPVQVTPLEPQDADDVLVVTLQHAVCQLHQEGLVQCVKSADGMISLATSGMIQIWSQHRLARMVEQCGLQHHDRYAHSTMWSRSCTAS